MLIGLMMLELPYHSRWAVGMKHRGSSARHGILPLPQLALRKPTRIKSIAEEIVRVTRVGASESPVRRQRCKGNESDPVCEEEVPVKYERRNTSR